MRGLQQLVLQPSVGFSGKRHRGLAEALLEVGADGLDELGAVDTRNINSTIMNVKDAMNIWFFPSIH